MELTVLIGNNVLPSWYLEWGLSFQCTDVNAKAALSKVVNMEEVGVGLKLTYE